MYRAQVRGCSREHMLCAMMVLETRHGPGVAAVVHPTQRVDIKALSSFSFNKISFTYLISRAPILLKSSHASVCVCPQHIRRIKRRPLFHVSFRNSRRPVNRAAKCYLPVLFSSRLSYSHRAKHRTTNSAIRSALLTVRCIQHSSPPKFADTPDATRV